MGTGAVLLAREGEGLISRRERRQWGSGSRTPRLSQTERETANGAANEAGRRHHHLGRTLGNYVQL